MTERLHLRPRHRERLEALLREHLPDVEAWAYGSRVNGRSHDGSDLDLVLRGPGLEAIPIDRGDRLRGRPEGIDDSVSRRGAGLGEAAGALSPGDRAGLCGVGPRPWSGPTTARSFWNTGCAKAWIG